MSKLVIIINSDNIIYGIVSCKRMETSASETSETAGLSDMLFV